MNMIENLKYFFGGSKILQDARHNPNQYEEGISRADKEMRKSTRLNTQLGVSYRVKNSGKVWIETTSKDYSSQGIRVVLAKPLRHGTAIEINISLPEVDHPIHMHGFVAWVTQTSHRHAKQEAFDCGIAFDEVQQNTNKEKLVYLIANKLSQLGLRVTRHLTAAPVQSVDDLKACYRTVYKGYVARGYCSPNESEMYYHYYSFLPESRTFALKDNEKLLGTISLIVDSPCGLPMDNLFGREIDHLRANGRKLAEVSLLALAHNDKKRKIFSLANFDKQIQLFRLFKIMYEYAHNVAGVTDLVIGVHPKHETLYKYLMFRTMGAPKKYSEAGGNLALPLHLDLISAKQNYNNCLKDFFTAEATPLDKLRCGIVPNGELMRQFLCEEQVLWPLMSSKVQGHFKQVYPECALDILKTH